MEAVDVVGGSGRKLFPAPSGGYVSVGGREAASEGRRRVEGGRSKAPNVAAVRKPSTSG